MPTTIAFYTESILLGIGLAIDAFSASLANGLNEPCMRPGKAFSIAGVFALFQTAMPLIGWFLIKSVLHWFEWLDVIVPWLALALLGFLGGKMLHEGIQNRHCTDACSTGQRLRMGALLVQGVATSIDALSAGLDFSSYNWAGALVAACIIGILTFGLCVLGVELGKRTGTRLAGKAGIFGGVILIVIGLKIFITSWF